MVNNVSLRFPRFEGPDACMHVYNYEFQQHKFFVSIVFNVEETFYTPRRFLFSMKPQICPSSCQKWQIFQDYLFWQKNTQGTDSFTWQSR